MPRRSHYVCLCVPGGLFVSSGLYGYARVSTLDQNLGIQRAALKVAGCDVIRAEKASGIRRDGRTELQVLLDFLRPGDALVVTRIDRLARSLREKDSELAEWSLAHITGSGTERAYRRSDALERRRVLLAEWAAYCGGE